MWQRETTTFADLPAEIRQQIYHYLAVPKLDREGLSNLLAFAKTNHANYQELQAFIFEKMHPRLSIHEDLTYELGLCNETRKKLTTRSLSSFTKNVYTRGFSNLHRIHIHVDFMVVGQDSPSFQVLGAFFDELVRLLDRAPLISIKVDYATSSKSSSSGTSIGSSEGIEAFLDLSQGPAFGVSLTSSPVSTTPTIQAQQNLLQTPPVLYLVAKLNPIMARVKKNSQGRVSVQRSSAKLSDKNESVRSDIGPRTPVRRTNSNSAIERAVIPGTTGRTSSRSSSAMRSTRRGQVLFPDVPM